MSIARSATLVAVVTIIACATVAAAFVPLGDAPPPIPNQFTANITVVEGGLPSYSGYIVADSAAQRYFRFVLQLNESTYQFQEFGAAKVYTYTIMNSGCTCQTSNDGIITNIFASLAAARKSTKPCNGTSGTLYVNSIFRGLPGVPASSYCIDGSVPQYIDEGGLGTKVMHFSNFKAGPPSWFPIDPMDKWVEECAGNCL